MNDIKEAVKLYGITFFAGILSLIMYTAVVAPAPSADATAVMWANIAAFVLQTVLFLALPYDTVWKWGERDRGVAKHQKTSVGRGLKLGLIASIPAIASYVLLVADKLFGFWPSYPVLFRTGQIAFAPVMTWAFGNGKVLIHQVSWGGILLSAVPVLVLPLIAALYYRLGYARVNVKEKLMYKKQK